MSTGLMVFCIVDFLVIIFPLHCVPCEELTVVFFIFIYSKQLQFDRDFYIKWPNLEFLILETEKHGKL